MKTRIEALRDAEAFADHMASVMDYFVGIMDRQDVPDKIKRNSFSVLKLKAKQFDELVTEVETA